MATYTSLSKKELSELEGKLQAEYEAFKAKGLKLDMSRGKPGADQLDLSLPILDCIDSSEACKAENGTDCRNYGLLDGIPEAKRLFADMLEVKPSEIIIGGNSSLNMMYDTVARAMTHGLLHSEKPWAKLDRVKFLCPVPGYDRHFTICEHFGIEMINIETTPEGPDMEQVKKLVESDPAVKGIWCVPKYSNPAGTTCSDAVVDALAALKPAAGDFRIYWDNAYCVHHLTDEHDHLKNLLETARACGNEDMVFLFGSTSKVTFPGSGVAMMAASAANIEYIKKLMFPQTIGPDKLNQLRHVRFFGDLAGMKAHMKKHAALIAPKFDAVLNTFANELAPTGVAEWTNPRGGYFISFNAMDGCAKEIVRLCKEAGLVVTPAGATFPYGKDPRDRNIRIAPTFPPLAELKTAISLFCLCVKLVSVQMLLRKAA